MHEGEYRGSRRRTDVGFATVARRLNREVDTATISLTRADGRKFTVAGRGVSLPQRYTDALAQLPPGEYVCDAVSTPASVYSDVIVRDTMLHERVNNRAALPYGQYERQPVLIGGPPIS